MVEVWPWGEVDLLEAALLLGSLANGTAKGKTFA